jgi:hypothetical protein
MKKGDEIFMKHFDITKLTGAKWIGYVVAGIAALTAFSGSIQDQKREKTIEELGKRLTELEKRN